MLALPVHFQSKLQLPWIIRRRGLSGVGEQRADRGNIEAVSNIEDVHGRIQTHTLSETDLFCDSQIIEHCPRSCSPVASEVPVERKKRPVEVRDTRFLEDTGRRELGIDSRSASRMNERIRAAGKGRQLRLVAVPA